LLNDGVFFFLYVVLGPQFCYSLRGVCLVKRILSGDNLFKCFLVSIIIADRPVTFCECFIIQQPDIDVIVVGFTTFPIDVSPDQSFLTKLNPFFWLVSSHIKIYQQQIIVYDAWSISRFPSHLYHFLQCRFSIGQSICADANIGLHP
jgi:hypothetical protein